MGFSDYERKIYDTHTKENLTVLVHQHWTKEEYEELLELGHYRKGWRKNGYTTLMVDDLLCLIADRKPDLRPALIKKLNLAKQRAELEYAKARDSNKRAG